MHSAVRRGEGARDSVPIPRADWALFLDVDGTLLDIAATPQEVVVPAELRGILSSLIGALNGAVALVSGRSLRDVDHLFAPLRSPAAGQHGAEIRLPEGGEREMPAGPALAAVRRRLNQIAVEHPGVMVEDKGASVTAHYRLAPDSADLLRAVIAEELTKIGADYQLLESKMAYDIKPKRFSKGSALAEFMRGRPFAGRRPVFIGDDETDQDGFAAAMRLGGHAIQIGPRPAGPGIHFISGPRILRTWLAALPEAIAGREADSTAAS